MSSLKRTPIVTGASYNSQLFAHIIFSITEKKGLCSLVSEANMEAGAVKRRRIKQVERSLGSLSKQSVVSPAKSGGQAPRCHSLESQK